MTLQYIIKTLQDIALLQPNINSCGNGDIYNFINGNPQTKYSLFFVTQGTHREQNNIDYYNLNLFYLDRLTQDKKNNLRIQSTAKECLSNIIKSFCETFDVEVNSQINYTPFTETFSNDLCSGVYCNLTFEVMQETDCAEQYGEYIKPIIQVINNQDITITENGVYHADNGYSGFGEVKVEVSVDDYYNRGFEEGFAQGETEGYNDGFSEGFDDGKIEGYEQGFDNGVVNGREEQKSLLESIKITENGIFDNENGFDVVDVDLPIQEIKELEIRTNGNYEILPDDDNIAIEKLVLNVESKPKVVIPNGLSFKGSTFTDFPVENYDWSKVYSSVYMFSSCPNLNVEPIIQAINNGTIPTLQCDRMFEGVKVEKIEGIDFTKFLTYLGMFDNVEGLKEVRNCNFSNITTNKINYTSLIYSPNSYFKMIDCDYSNTTYDIFMNNILYWYFANFKEIPTSWQHLPNNNQVSERVYVMECDKPDTLNINSNSSIWYDDTKYSGWDSFGGSHTYGFWYKIVNDKNHDFNVKITQREDITKYQFEQILPYNEEKDCYYIDYPYAMYFDIYVNDVKIPCSNKFNLDLYFPNVQVENDYQGLEIGNCIDYVLNSPYVIDNEGLKNGESHNLTSTKIVTPTDYVEITFNYVSRYCTFYWNNMQNNQGISTNGQVVTINTENIDVLDIIIYTGNPTENYITNIKYY